MPVQVMRPASNVAIERNLCETKMTVGTHRTTTQAISYRLDRKERHEGGACQSPDAATWLRPHSWLAPLPRATLPASLTTMPTTVPPPPPTTTEPREDEGRSLLRREDAGRRRRLLLPHSSHLWHTFGSRCCWQQSCFGNLVGSSTT